MRPTLHRERPGARNGCAVGGHAKSWFGLERGSAMSAADKCLTPPNDGGLSLASIGLRDESVDAGSALAQARTNLRNPRPTVVVHHP